MDKNLEEIETAEALLCIAGTAAGEIAHVREAFVRGWIERAKKAHQMGLEIALLKVEIDTLQENDRAQLQELYQRNAQIDQLQKKVGTPGEHDHRCQKAPGSFQCTRLAGHDGPCAAVDMSLPTSAMQKHWEMVRELPTGTLVMICPRCESPNSEKGWEDNSWHCTLCGEHTNERP